MPKRERMSPVDTAWLRMDRESNLMMIVGVLVLDKPVDLDRLRDTVQVRLAQRFRRFRQRVVQDLTGAWWENDPEFSIDHHVVVTQLPGQPSQSSSRKPGSKAAPGTPQQALQNLVSDLAAQPLDPAHALWRMDVIPHFEGGSAVVVRIHHCIADGIALIGVMLSLTDADESAAPVVPEAAPSAAEAAEAAQALVADADNPWGALLDPLTNAATTSLKMSTAFWSKYMAVMTNPEKAMKLSRHGVGLTAELAKLVILPADSPTRFKGRAGAVKRVAWSERLDLEEIKAVGKPLGCSVNDVLLSAVAGALRRYLVAQGDPVDDVEIRAMVPVNLRTKADAGKLGNRFGLVTLLLPVHEANPFARLMEVRRRMEELKRSYLPPLSLGLLGAMGLAPKLVQGKALDLLASKATAVMTNVPGPREPLYLAGCRIGQIMFWVPQSGDIGVGVSILSYANTVQFGLITDQGFVPDPQAITPLFRREFESLLWGLMLHEGPGPLDPQALEAQLAAEVAALSL